MKKLVLIDGNSLINRAFYALPPLVTKDGVPTNAVYGFLNMFFKMISDIKPTYVAVAFDLKAPTFRHKMFDGYKATRKPMPDELRPQLPLLKELLTLMNIAIVEKEGFEADDIIGTIAKSTDIDTIIYTGDRDSFQLVDEQTSVYFTKRGISDIDILNAENFEEKTTIKPYQIIELKALMGDASDNIPGVLGIGEKTAYNLLHEYNNVDNLYANIDNLKGKMKDKIASGKESCYLSKTLATIDIKAPIDLDIEKMIVNLPFSTDVKRRFSELEFKGLLSKNDFFDGESVKETKISEEIIDREKIEDIASFNKIVFSNNLCAIFDEYLISIFDIDNKTEYNIKIRQSLIDDGIDYSEFFRNAKNIFNDTKKIIVFNKKEANKFFNQNSAFRLNNNTEDVALIKYLVDFSGRDDRLSDVLIEYAGNDNISAHSLYLVYEILKKKLIEYNIEKLYYEVELPLSDVLFDMENEGFKIDIGSLTEIGKKYEKLLVELEKEVKELLGEPTLNINSTRQLGDVLFEKLKIGKAKKTKTGYSTSAEVLEELEDSHPAVPQILRYRQVQKLYSTYVKGFYDLIDKKTGIIHTSFNQTVTATGRLSSKEPNLQNIPVRDSEGRELRKFFVSKNENGVLISADYSQIELRLTASFSNCKPLIDAFNNGEDIHALTASRVFNVPLNMVSEEMRRNAKAVNFGIIYGISEYGLAKNLKILAKEAKSYIDNYFEQYPEIKQYMNNNIEFAKKNGYAVTILGRRRYIRELLSSNYNLRQFGERVAMNMPLQGSSADIIKLAMINVYNRLKKENLKTKLILQVHDELILDAPIEECEIAKRILKEEMENAVKLAVKLTVEVGEGKTWFEA